MRRWLVISLCLAALTGAACLCSYSLTRTSDAFDWWLSLGLVVLGVGFTGVTCTVSESRGWDERKYALVFLALLLPVTLLSRHATPIVGASAIGSRCAVYAGLMIRGLFRQAQRPIPPHG